MLSKEREHYVKTRVQNTCLEDAQKSEVTLKLPEEPCSTKDLQSGNLSVDVKSFA